MDRLEFFEKYNINPPLPSFPIEGTALFHNNYPRVIVLKYDISKVNRDTLEEMNNELYNYSSLLPSSLNNVGQALYLDKEKSFYLTYISNNDAYYVFIEVIVKEGQKLSISNPSLLLMIFDNKKIEDDENDYMEEAIDDELGDEESLIPYTLIIKFDCKWPNLSEKTACGYEIALPLSCYKDKTLNLPYIDHSVQITGIDCIHDIINIQLFLNEVYYLDLRPGGKEEFEFAYCGNLESEDTYREGSIVISLRKDIFDYREAKGMITVNEILYNYTSDETLSDDSGHILTISSGRDSEYIEAFGYSDNTYRVFRINKEANFIIMQAQRNDYSDESKIVTTYFPLFPNQATAYHDSWVSPDGRELESRIKAEYKLLFERESN